MVRKMTHVLKIIPKFAVRVLYGNKKAEIRYNDRDFKVGDFVVFAVVVPVSFKASEGRVFDDKNNDVTAEISLDRELEKCIFEITDIVTSEEFPQGIQKGYCVLSLSCVRGN
jgi:hypothetical protein